MLVGRSADHWEMCCPLQPLTLERCFLHAKLIVLVCLLFRFTYRMGGRIYVRRSPLLYQVSWRFSSWRKEDISLSLACLTAAVISDRRPLTHTHRHTHSYHIVFINAFARTLKAYTSSFPPCLKKKKKSNYREGDGVKEGLTCPCDSMLCWLNRLNLLVFHPVNHINPCLFSSCLYCMFRTKTVAPFMWFSCTAFRLSRSWCV